MKSSYNWFGTVGTAAILALSGSSAWADTLAENPLIGTSGDGLIFSDPAEGVQPPGVKAVTFTRTRVDGDEQGEFDYVDPFEVIITDFTDGGGEIENRGDVVNCLMANNPDIYCDSAPGSGKRIKVQLTGPTPFDMTFATLPNGSYTDVEDQPVDTSSVDYFTFGKVSNFTGARITGFSLQLLDAEGNLMGTLDPEDAVLFNLGATDIGLGSRLVDGLFGAGGQENDIGFFSEDRAGFAPTLSEDTLEFGALGNADHVAAFGTAFLDNTMVPDGLFWADSDDPDDEAKLIAWDNIGGDGWTYGNIAPAEIPDEVHGGGDPEDVVLLDEVLDNLAADLGVTVEELDYEPGGTVPDAIVAATQSNGLFDMGAVEDLRNANLNYDMTLGEVEAGEFTLRWTAEFAPIVQTAQSEFEFQLAGYLDGAANVPYWDLGNAAQYQAAIEDILELSPDAQSAALQSTTFNIAPAFTNLGFETGRNQVAALTNMAPVAGGDAGVGATQAGGARSWEITNGLYGLFSGGGSLATYDETSASAGYDVSSFSFTAGLERSVTDFATVGLAIGGSTGTAEASDELGEIDQTGLAVTAFTRGRFATDGSFQALLGYQDISYETTRNVLDEVAEGETDGSQVYGAVSIDYLRDFGAFRIGPKASFEYYDISIDDFEETGAGGFNLSVSDQTSTTVVSSLGLAGTYQLPNAGGDSMLTGGVAYTNVSGDDLDIDTGFVGLPTINVPVQGIDQDLIDVNLGITSVLASDNFGDMVISAGYDGSFGDDYTSHGIQVGLNLQF